MLCCSTSTAHAELHLATRIWITVIHDWWILASIFVFPARLLLFHCGDSFYATSRFQYVHIDPIQGLFPIIGILSLKKHRYIEQEVVLHGCTPIVGYCPHARWPITKHLLNGLCLGLLCNPQPTIILLLAILTGLFLDSLLLINKRQK